MSCQSLAARAFAEPEKDAMTHCGALHRTVRFSSESRGSTRSNREHNESAECKRETTGSISLTALSVTPVTSQSSAMSQSAPPASATFDLAETPAPPAASCRFPKLEDCAHFHYDRVSLGGLSIETVPCEENCNDWSPSEGWICLKVRSHVNSTCDETVEPRTLSTSWSEASEVGEWTLTRNRDNFLQLDDMLHRCIYDRKVSGLPNLSEEMTSSVLRDETEYRRLISDYVHHLSIIADDSINCGPVLNWLQMDNKGHKLLVANEDSSSINTPAVAAAYSVRKYVSQARDEISFEVGDMISIIDMPGPSESLWWRGKRGFRVGFFPHHCVAVIGDKVPRHMTQPPPIVGSVAVAPIKPVLRKHGKLISLFRSFILSRPSRRSLKQQGILRERVFGCDLGEHLLNCGHEVPLVLVECANAIEERGAVDGIYRLSGGSGLTQRLRAAFDSGSAPDLAAPAVARDPHAVASLLKMYFRELPNPLCTYQLYESFVCAVQAADEAAKLRAVRDTVVKLPPPHYRTLAYLMRHLRRVSLLGPTTGMTARNMAIVWAPNLLRSPRPQHALQGVAVQAVVTEFLICFAEDLFAQEQGADSGPESLEQEPGVECQVELRGSDSCRRPKSLPLNPPTKLLSLEEARRRGKSSVPSIQSPRLPPPSGAIAAAAGTQLRPQGNVKPKYIEVGSGPNNLPQYHTVLDLPLPGAKRGLKRSPSGWRGLFSRSKQQRPRSARAMPSAPITAPVVAPTEDIPMPGLRPVKSYESLTSDTDTLAPLADRVSAPIKHHTRSSSCDSYFEPWQAELADMRLRLSPQERDHHMFSEEDDTALHNLHAQGQDSLCSTPPESGLCSAEPSPRRNLRVDIEAANELAERKRTALEEQLASIGYIDGESPRAGAGKPPEKRQCPARPASPPRGDLAKRLCKDRDSPLTSLSDFQSSLGSVKLRERTSPRKTKSTSRYSNLHHQQPTDVTVSSRLSWHGKDGHSTLIKIDWPIDNSSISNLTTSTLNSTPITPITPVYDPLESDSEVSEANKHTIKIENKSCDNCDEEKCLKCELKATDYENAKFRLDNLHDSLERLDSNYQTAKSAEYQNLQLVRHSPESRSGHQIKRTSSYHNVETIEQSPRNSSYQIDLNSPYQNVKEVDRNQTNTNNQTKRNSTYNILERPVDSPYKTYGSRKHSYENFEIIEHSPVKNSQTEKNSNQNLERIEHTDRNSSRKSSQQMETSPYQNVEIVDRSPTNTSCKTDKNSSYQNLEIGEHSMNPDYQNFEIENPNYQIGRNASYQNLEISHSLETNYQNLEISHSPDTNYQNLEISHSPDSNYQNLEISHSPDSNYQNLEISHSPDSSFQNVEKLEHSPVRDISYKNLNRLSAVSMSSNSDPSKNDDGVKLMTSSHESSSSFSNASLKHGDDYESFNYTRPNYINLQSSSTSKSSPGSPLKSPLKSTISITYRSPTKVSEYERIDRETPTNDRDSVFEDLDLEKNLSIVEDASVPDTDASLPTQQACQPNFNHDLIILESPTQDSVDVYSQVKFFKKSIEEVNSMILESPEKERHYENINFETQKVNVEFENINVDTLKICDKDLELAEIQSEGSIDNELKSHENYEKDNGNTIKPKSNLNVKELAIRFESPTEQKGPFVFEKFKAEIKYPSLERKDEDKASVEIRKKDTKAPPVSPKPYKLSKNSCNARSLDEIAFIKEFGNDKTYNNRRKSLEVRDRTKMKFLPDLNLNLEENKCETENDKACVGSITPTTENKISLVQRFDIKKPCDIKTLLGFDAEKKLSRERIEKYKEERRNFLREKYSSQSFRSSPEQLTRIKIKKDEKSECDRLRDDTPKFERRNTVDLGQRMRFSLAKSATNLDSIPSPTSPDKNLDFPRERYDSAGRSREFDRKEKVSPSFNIRDMAAMFEQKSQNTNTG